MTALICLPSPAGTLWAIFGGFGLLRGQGKAWAWRGMQELQSSYLIQSRDGQSWQEKSPEVGSKTCKTVMYHLLLRRRLRGQGFGRQHDFDGGGGSPGTERVFSLHTGSLGRTPAGLLPPRWRASLHRPSLLAASAGFSSSTLEPSPPSLVPGFF